VVSSPLPPVPPPNRVFRVEYRTIYFGETSATPTLNYEVNVYENGLAGLRLHLRPGQQHHHHRPDHFNRRPAEHNTVHPVRMRHHRQSPPVATGQKLTATLQACGSPTPTATPTTTASPVCSPAGWSAGAPLPTPGVRAAGVYFPANGRFYTMGGRASDTAGNEFTHPFEYNPATDTWTTKAATYPDNMVNNIACGVLTDAGTPYIYCVGGSVVSTPTAATGRVFRYNPVTDTITPVAAPWPAAGTTVIPGGFTVFQNKLYILGGFDTVTGGGQGINQIWEFTPSPAGWMQKPTVSPCSAGLHTHHDHRQPHLHGWGQRYLRLVCLPIRPTPLFITRWRIRSARLPPYRERQERRGRLTSTAKCW